MNTEQLDKSLEILGWISRKDPSRSSSQASFHSTKSSKSTKETAKEIAKDAAKDAAAKAKALGFAGIHELIEEKGVQALLKSVVMRHKGEYNAAETLLQEGVLGVDKNLFKGNLREDWARKLTLTNIKELTAFVVGLCTI